MSEIYNIVKFFESKYNLIKYINTNENYTINSMSDIHQIRVFFKNVIDYYIINDTILYFFYVSL